MDGSAAIALAALVTGRVPGTSSTFDGVHMESHVVHETREELTKRVEIEDVIANDSYLDLEARYSFRLPLNAALTRVSLEIDGRFVDGETINRDRARDIYDTIVEPPRRKDPALVERQSDGSISVKIFPVPAHGTRRIAIQYETVNDVETSNAAIAFGHHGFIARVSRREALPKDAAQAIIVDRSHSRTDAALATEITEARRIVSALPEGAPFAILACDSACTSFPGQGTTMKSDATFAAADAFLSEKKQGGARDVVGAIAAATLALGARGRITYVGSARATAGEIVPAQVIEHVRCALAPHADQLELTGIPVDDAGDLDALVASAALVTPLPDSLVPLVQTYEHETLTVIGSLKAPFVGSVEIAGRSIVPTSSLAEKTSVDLLVTQAQIDALERTHDDASLDRAAAIARAHRLLATRAAFIVLEDEEMFAHFGVARSPGAARGKEHSAPPPPQPRRAHFMRPVMLRMSMVTVIGHLDAESIRHVIHQNYARIRFCYEQGLREDPQLKGRVTVKFLIDRTGTVAAAQDGGSDLPDHEVTKCIVQSITKIAFPADVNGSITVIYPFQLSPEEGLTTEHPLLRLRIPQSAARSPHDSWALRMSAIDHPFDRAALEQAAFALADDGTAAEQGRAWDALADLSPERADVHLHAALAYARAFDFERATAHAAALRSLASKTSQK